MFTDRYFGKKRSKAPQNNPLKDALGPRIDPVGSEPVGTEPVGAQPVGTDPVRADPVRAAAVNPADRHPARSGALAAPFADEAEAADPLASMEGLSIAEYARRHEFSESEVWRRLRRGELTARTEQGQVTIYSSQEAAALAEPSQHGLTKTSGRQSENSPNRYALDTAPPGASSEPELPLPPLPEEAGRKTSLHADRQPPAATKADSYLTLSGERSHSPEVALLLDHLSLAKEENREILRMTQESIRKVTELTEAIVEMKDTVIEAKDTQIGSLTNQLAERERQIKSLLQQKEDLEMLARTLASTPRNRTT